MKPTRTFIALPLSSHTRSRVLQLQQNLADSQGGVKWVEEGNLHLTLLFLGELRELDLVQVCRTVDKISQKLEPFTLEFEGMDAFPNRRRPRILYLDIIQGKEELMTLHQKLETPIWELGCYRREARPYTPHLTLGRLGTEDETGVWSSVIQRYGDYNASETRAEEILVMGSELHRDGPMYTVLARAPLLG